MPRPKNASKRGNFQSASRGRGRAGNALAPFEGNQKGHGFTLQEEARNTERHQSFWNTDQRLRDSKVSFISAGKFEPTKLDENETALAQISLQASKLDIEGHEVAGAHEHEEEVEKVQEELEVIVVEEAAEESSIKILDEGDTFNFIVDTHGTQPIHTGMAAPRVRSVSPTPSTSSEEVILFRGRDHQGRGLSTARQPSTSLQNPPARTDPIKNKIRVVEDKLVSLKEELRLGEALHSSAPHSSTESHSADFEAILPPRPNQNLKARTRRDRRSNKTTERLVEDESMADYIANMDKDDPIFKSFTQRDLGGMEEEAWQDTEASSGEAVGESSKAFKGDWNRSDIEDFDDLSTSDGVLGEVQAILSKRERASGTQYLVVWENHTTDEARWVPSTTLTSIAALVHVDSFEAEEKLVAEFADHGEEGTSDSTDDMDLESDDDDGDNDNQDLVQRRIDRMSDEKIARLLAKQEELGMGSDEILLLDAYEDEEASPVDDISFSNSAYHSAIAARQAKSLRGPSRARGDFPSATLMADAYDGFDVMDFERPSVQRRSKGHKGKLTISATDSEFEASMQLAWENDRMKKKDRKQQREELRAQGLLGSKNGKVDMKAKYPEGMAINAIKEEIKDFLLGDNTTLALPPMDKDNRKIVHEIANAFYLKSKSAGNGIQRFPILTKTIRTRSFNNNTFNAVDARITRRFLPRMDVSGKRTGGGARRGGGGANNAAVQYRDGDVVGGSAPQLGIENRGHAMLEKMGWTSGMALGSLNNKGILQPVSHVVKTGKAGLG